MATLDQSVAATFDPKRRFALLQDKVIFCLLRFTELSTSAIHNFRVQNDEALPNTTDEFRFMPAGCRQVNALWRLQKHVQSERAKFAKTTDSLNVFISPYTGRALSDSAIQMRFHKAVQHAFLTAAIPSMRAYKVANQLHGLCN